MKKTVILFAILFSVSLFAEPVNFYSNPMKAGKALLSENAYAISRLLDTVNFSPELKLPIQLLYNSNREKSGIFGFAWYSPQLESTAYYDKDGVLWVTPWGERIKFFPKKEETPKDAIKIELYEQAKKGRGFYAPYSEWEANTNRKDFKKSTNWIFSGKRDKKGWRFIYREGRLRKILAPSGRFLEFTYTGNKLNGIIQEGLRFVEIQYARDTVCSMKINGVEFNLQYQNTTLKILPKTLKGNIISATRPCLTQLKRADLSSEKFSYDNYGFLSGINRGSFSEKLQIQHQSLLDRRKELTAQSTPQKNYSGPINGRLLSDGDFKYSYPSSVPGIVELTNKLNQKASYNYNHQTGIFRVTEFSGKSSTIYYFMRHDVAYLGKVRKIVDGRGRDIVNYRYDKLTGNVIRVRDMVGNDINFEYGENGKVSRITRRGAEQLKPEPVQAFRYDQNNNLTAQMLLNKEGRIVTVTRLSYNQAGQPVSISQGRGTTSVGYNSYGYPVVVENAFKQNIFREYDKYNRMICSTDFYGVKTYYSYTPAGLISQIERKDDDKLLSSLTIKYDSQGFPESYIDHVGKTKSFERDAWGRVVKELFPDDTEVSYTYNVLGQLATVLDQNQNKIKFAWNRFGMDAKTTPVGQLTDYVHDQYGLLKQMLSKQGKEQARSISYEYDQYDRLIKLDYGNGDIETRSYDSWGKLLTSQRGKEKFSYQYDYWGRLISRKGNNDILTITYNPWGERTGRFIEVNGVKMKESRIYDNLGRLKKIISEGKTVEYVYNAQNQIHQQIINGKVITFTYDKYGHFKSKKMIETTANNL